MVGRGEKNEQRHEGFCHASKVLGAFQVRELGVGEVVWDGLGEVELGEVGHVFVDLGAVVDGARPRKHQQADHGEHIQVEHQQDQYPEDLG